MLYTDGNKINESGGSMKDEAIKAAAIGTPPGFVTALNYLSDIPVEKWLTVALIIYTVLQIGVLVTEKIIRRNKRRDRHAWAVEQTKHPEGYK